jgi:hypothetical protein
MRYKPKSIAALHIALVDCQIRCGSRWTEKSEYAVGDLRKVTTWPENLVTPQERHPESAVKISKVTLATRVSPKQ